MLFSLPDDEKSSIRALRLLTEVTLFSNLMPRSSRLYAGVAQLVEQRIRNAKVAGSTPVSGTSSHSPQRFPNQKTSYPVVSDPLASPLLATRFSRNP